jgi:hypothetical protein
MTTEALPHRQANRPRLADIVAETRTPTTLAI